MSREIIGTVTGSTELTEDSAQPVRVGHPFRVTKKTKTIISYAIKENYNRGRFRP